jgi:hypothetical protein
MLIIFGTICHIGGQKAIFEKKYDNKGQIIFYVLPLET